ncbi:MAG TPA: hypothetical protein VGS20_13540 [Candidatus Acidoferrales bacterium]|nr:hypothetical protein [Candidatus Acidoferrales bacterium]
MGAGSPGQRQAPPVKPSSLLSLAIGLALAFVCATAGRSRQQPAASAAFPLSQGTYWLYDGLVRWRVPGATEHAEKEVHWRMEVRQVIRRNAIVGAVVRGYLYDLNGAQGDVKPADRLIVQSGENKYYLIPAFAYEKAVARLDDPRDSLADLVADDELILDLPLAPLKKFCGLEGMARTDGFYCWVVGESTPAALSDVKGAPAGAYTAYPIQFVTVPDATSIQFVPGLGILSYTYRNHDTEANTEMSLVEFHRGGR